MESNTALSMKYANGQLQTCAGSMWSLQSEPSTPPAADHSARCKGTDAGIDSQRPFALVIVAGMLSRIVVDIFLMSSLYKLVTRKGATVCSCDRECRLCPRRRRRSGLHGPAECVQDVRSGLLRPRATGGT